jgi:anti-sigma-K factor RskA
MRPSLHNPTWREPPEDLAGELALGVLDPQAHASARARLATDARFADDYERWSLRLAPLALTATEVAPSKDLWPQIRARLSANEDRPARENDALMWRAAAAGFAAVCLGLVLTLSVQRFGPHLETSTPQIAMLKSSDGTATAVASVDAVRHRVRLMRGALRAPKDRALELWVIVGKRAPVPVGVFGAASDSARDPEFTLPASHLSSIATPVVLAVSIEPLGGSPTNSPTGPIIATGRLTAI